MYRETNEHSLPARLRSLDKMGVTFGNSEDSIPLSIGRRMGQLLQRARMPGPLGNSLHSIISTDLQASTIPGSGLPQPNESLNDHA